MVAERDALHRAYRPADVQARSDLQLRGRTPDRISSQPARERKNSAATPGAARLGIPAFRRPRQIPSECELLAANAAVNAADTRVRLGRAAESPRIPSPPFLDSPP